MLPSTTGVRVGSPKEPSAALRDLAEIAEYHRACGDTIVSHIDPTLLRIKLRSGGRILYRLQGPLQNLLWPSGPQ